MVLDYTWERREELIRAEEFEDGRQLGRAEGEKAGRAETEQKLLQHIMETMNLPETDARKVLGI